MVLNNLNLSLQKGDYCALLGPNGSGKTTFSKMLSLKLGIPSVSMDDIYWEENWKRPSDSDFQQKLEAIEKWQDRASRIKEGKYNSLQITADELKADIKNRYGVHLK